MKKCCENCTDDKCPVYGGKILPSEQKAYNERMCRDEHDYESDFRGLNIETYGCGHTKFKDNPISDTNTEYTRGMNRQWIKATKDKSYDRCFDCWLKEKSISQKNREMNKDIKMTAEAQYPNNIMVEVTNACNLNCNMCYHSKMQRKIGYMTEELFTKIMTEARLLRIENVGLYTTGEAFLHPKIFDFIKIAKDYGIKYVYITTNGQALNENKIKKIIESGLDSIKFSIDAGSRECYESQKRGADWNRLLSNIKKLRTLRDKERSRLRIFASYVITRDNEADIDAYKTTFRDLIDETIFTGITNQGGQKDNRHLELKNTVKRHGRCNLLWDRFIVTYDGRLTICCIDFDAQMIYGNLNKDSLMICWNNENMKEYRKMHMERQFRMLPMCLNCDKTR